MAPRNPNELTEAEREENIEAQFGAQDDGDTGTGATETLDQNSADPLEGGVERREPIRNSPQDSTRMAIASRFRRPEVEERPFNGDMTDPENTYGQFGAEPSEEGDDDLTGIDDQRQTAAVPAKEPSRKKVVVRGKEMMLTDDEILAAAQKTLAGDSYLDEAKTLLAEAKEIRAARTGATRQHPDGEMGAQDELDSSTDTDAQHSELPVDLVQKLQFGDPEEAARELAEYVNRSSKKAAATSVEQSGVQRAFDQDLSRSQKALKAFTDANPDLANDEIAAMAIERGMYSLYREDLLKLGYAEDKLPTTPKEIANWHRFCRVNGYEVRNTSDLLEASKGKFLEWRGGKQAPQQQQQQRQAKPAPRIAVSVNRDARREAIPLQPSRAAAPRRDAQTQGPSTRSDVVKGMRAQRGQV